MIKLRPVQELAIQHLSEGIQSGHKRQILMSATGTGKTTIAAAIIERALEKGKRIWFTVDTHELVTQAYDTFVDWGFDTSIIQGRNHPLTNYRKPVQVIMNQTLKNRWSIWDINPQWMPDLIFHDEAHIQYKAHHQIALAYPHIPTIGLSATPFSKGLGKLYSNLIIGETTADAIKMGHLCDYDAYAPFTPDMKGVKVSGGDYNPLAASVKVDRREVVGDIIKNWKEKTPGKSTLVFACNVAHSKHIAEQFQNAGVNAVHLDGYTDKKERHEVIKAYKRGEIPVLTSVMVLTKGFDAPRAEVCILAAPTKSLMKFIQMCGRVLRTFKTKHKAVIFDHAGNFERLGFPTDPLPTHLCDGDAAAIKERKEEAKKNNEEEKKPHACNKCKALITEFVCPVCGHVPKIEHGVIQSEGELKKVRKGHSDSEKMEFLAGMIQYAKTKGYKDGYAIFQYKEKYGEFPRGQRPKPIEPNSDVVGWIKHQAIKRRFKRVAS